MSDTDYVRAIQARLTVLLNLERDLVALGPQFDVLDKREVLARVGLLASETLSAFNYLVSSNRDIPQDGEKPWLPLDKAPRDGTPFELRTSCTFRWMPYKPNSQPAREGKLGRWQRLDEKSQWTNTPPPVGDWRPL